MSGSENTRGSENKRGMAWAWLRAWSKSAGIPLDCGQEDALARHLELVLEWNKRFNLTAIKDERSCIALHIADSLAAFPVCDNFLRHPEDETPRIISEDASSRIHAEDVTPPSLMDLGSGAGFPGLPLAVAFKGRIHLTMIDSVKKKTDFLEMVSGALAVGDRVNVVHSRAEDAARTGEHRGKYDIVTARALANMPTLVEYCLPFVKKGGILVAYKGRRDIAENEIKASKNALKLLGGELLSLTGYEINVPDAFLESGETTFSRSLIVIRKTRGTDISYPRKAGLPGKSPL